MRFVSALIVFQGMVNEIVLGFLDPLPLDSTSKVETFHPHGVFPIQLLPSYEVQRPRVTCDSQGRLKPSRVNEWRRVCSKTPTLPSDTST